MATVDINDYINDEKEQEKEQLLNSLKEEWNNIKTRSSDLCDNIDVIKEIFVTVKNRIEYDPIITEKLGIKKPKEASCVCYIF